MRGAGCSWSGGARGGGASSQALCPQKKALRVFFPWRARKERASPGVPCRTHTHTQHTRSGRAGRQVGGRGWEVGAAMCVWRGGESADTFSESAAAALARLLAFAFPFPTKTKARPHPPPSRSKPWRRRPRRPLPRPPHPCARTPWRPRARRPPPPRAARSRPPRRPPPPRCPPPSCARAPGRLPPGRPAPWPPGGCVHACCLLPLWAFTHALLPSRFAWRVCVCVCVRACVFFLVCPIYLFFLPVVL